MGEHYLSVLSIDDDLADGEILRLNLEDIPEWDTDFRRVGSAAEALAELQRSSPPSVIFVDYDLGSETGVDALITLRNSGFEGSLIFLTGVGDEHIVVEAFHNLDHVGIPPRHLRRHLDAAALGSELQGVVHEIGENLNDPPSIDDDLRQV